VPDGDPDEFQEPAKDVNRQEGAEVADVAVVVNRGAAGIHAEGFAVCGEKFVDSAGQGVEEAEGH